MPKRSKKFWFFSSLAGFLLLWTVVAVFRTGGIDRGFYSNADYAWASDLDDVTCEEKRISVKLSEDGWREFDLVGQLCWPGELKDQTLQVLVSGAGYGYVYWDFPYQPDTYSYARAALRAGDAVFNFDRLGMGLSDHPFGIALDVDTQAYVLHQALDVLASEHEFEATVMLGHSFGSTISLAHSLRWPEQSDGIVLTGFIHNFNPAFGAAMGQSIGFAAFSGPLSGSLVDPTYTISKPDSRNDVFYTTDNTDPEVMVTDNDTRETTAVGELISMSRYFADQSKQLTVPVFVLIGENDFVVCGEEGLDCTDHQAVIENELVYYPAQACPEIVVLDDTNHNANLHLNAQGNFALMLDWIGRRVGSAGNPASEPCL
ncbi:MAG: alpha/beta fold hydrolase [Gammaproteobacteria bacterium]